MQRLYAGHDRKISVDAIKTQDYPTPARRPAYLVLDCRRVTQTLSIQMPAWYEALDMALDV